MKSKVLFLDVDGVLNKTNTRERCLGFTGVDKALASKFTAWWGKHKDVEIVLSSTWRTDPRMWYALKEEGIDWDEITNEFPWGGRSVEIADFLKKFSEIKRYAILDDNDYSWTEDQYKVFVQTNEQHGFTEAEATELDEIFSKEVV